MSSPGAPASSSCFPGPQPPWTPPFFPPSRHRLFAQLLISERENVLCQEMKTKSKLPQRFSCLPLSFAPFSLPTPPPSFSLLLSLKSLGVWRQSRNHSLQNHTTSTDLWETPLCPLLVSNSPPPVVCAMDLLSKPERLFCSKMTSF